MINEVHFKNFKALRDVTVPLERLTVIVGPNASGKTSILQGLYYLSQVDDDNAECAKFFSDERSPELLVNRQSEVDQQSEKSFTIQIIGTAGDLFFQAVLADEDVNVLGSKGEWSYSLTDRSPDQPQPAWGLEHAYRAAVLLRLDAAQLCKPSHFDKDNPCINFYGNGLSSVLANMALNRPDDFVALQEKLKSVIPIVNRVRFERTPIIEPETETIRINEEFVSRSVLREYTGEKIVFDMEGAPDIPAHLASEGTLLTLGLLTVLMGPTRPKLVLLDDFEFGLHPKAQKDLVGVIRKLMEQDPELQIVATSHSPYLLDHLRPEEVRLTTLDDDGTVICGSLTDHPDFEEWKEQMTPGEMWSMFGEDWLKDHVKQEQT